MKTWAIFRVHEHDGYLYKGGELSSTCNLTYDRFIGTLAGMFNVRLSLAEIRDVKIKRYWMILLMMCKNWNMWLIN